MALLVSRFIRMVLKNPDIQFTPVVSYSDYSGVSSYIKEYSLDTLPTFLYISASVISDYWCLKVNFLGPELHT